MTELEQYFESYRRNIIGIDAEIETPFGLRKLVYADWIASGRLMRTFPILKELQNGLS
jgi:hypothetical protein